MTALLISAPPKRTPPMKLRYLLAVAVGLAVPRGRYVTRIPVLNVDSTEL
jgi:hypothetical protein